MVSPHRTPFLTLPGSTEEGIMYYCSRRAIHSAGGFATGTSGPGGRSQDLAEVDLVAVELQSPDAPSGLEGQVEAGVCL